MLYIEQLKAKAIRNLGEFHIEPGPKLNYFYGPNASGKTSVLETIYLLSRVKSFRSKRIHDVISRGEKVLSVFAKGIQQEKTFTVGVEKGKGITKLKFNGEMVQTASEQAKKLPIYVLTPDHHTIFTGTPKERRHWLDWSLFHVEQNYLTIWKNYHRALRHRNTLLKSEKIVNTNEMSGWEKTMSEEAKKIDEMRQSYITDLCRLMNSNHINIVLSGQANIQYEKNSLDKELFEQLIENRKMDIKRGFTSIGPHRSDIKFSFEDFNVAKHLSRGQTKLYGAALVSAQIEILRSENISAIVLVDDIDAELDDESSKKMLNLLFANNVQTFVSSLSMQDWIPGNENTRSMFHVKHGKIKKVVE